MSNKNKHSLLLGANPIDKEFVSFRLWAPWQNKVSVRIFKKRGATETFPLRKDAEGYFYGKVRGVKAGDRYYYVLDGEKERPDPVSRYQSSGVHGPSEVLNPKAFKWSDSRWKGIRMQNVILYELHVGTFTQPGTFKAVIEKLPYLKKLGITMIELMPVAQFPGEHNWGYDGVSLYAPQKSYGGPEGLKALVNACHKQGIAVCLDVVYNHLGPEGNYLAEFGPYFTDRYRTPWGDAFNFDGHDSGGVREYVIQNALYWITEYHMDALRFDAVHSIFDSSPTPILQQVNACVKARARELGRDVVLMAESDLNDTRVIRSVKKGGWGLDAQWSDDFHHAVHQKLTGENQGYYQDFSGYADIGKALKESFVYNGRFSKFRQRKHGNSAAKEPAEKFIFCLQNHDQVGNRAAGDRLSESISFETQKMIAALLLFSPSIPLLWMGQEYGELAPFHYFIDHGDPELVRAVREGRKNEFASFGWKKGVMDPKAEKTFQLSKLNFRRAQKKPHSQLLRLYQDLVTLRKKQSFSKRATKKNLQVHFSEKEEWLFLHYKSRPSWGVFCSFSNTHRNVKIPLKKKTFEILIRTDELRYGGTGNFREKQLPSEFELMGIAAYIGRLK